MKSLVLGALGQDGRLLTSELSARGHDVVGLDRAASASDTVEMFDLRDAAGLLRVLEDRSPDLVFHFAALHGQAGSKFEDIWGDMMAINVTSLHTVLEYMRRFRPDTGLVYASSIKVFGEPMLAHIDDGTAMAPTCLYGISKQAASRVIDYYRRTHGLKASALHLSNHESWLRSPQFFIPKLVALLAQAVRDPTSQGTLYTLDFWCDWGDAAEYMAIVVILAEQCHLDRDYVIARGESVYARDLAECLFRRFGLDYRRHVIETSGGDAGRQNRSVINCTNLRAAIGYVPGRNIEVVCLDILRRNHSIEAP